jgi:formate dehydrogenase subunit delta
VTLRIENLSRMANQIASNNEALSDDEATRRVAEHLRSFWTPAMRRDLAAYAVEHPEALDPVVRAALVTA